MQIPCQDHYEPLYRCFVPLFEPLVVCVADACDGGDVYGMAGKSPQPQFTYPAFTFPGPQVCTDNGSIS
jgi:hypothetical protein